MVYKRVSAAWAQQAWLSRDRRDKQEPGACSLTIYRHVREVCKSEARLEITGSYVDPGLRHDLAEQGVDPTT